MIVSKLVVAFSFPARAYREVSRRKLVTECHRDIAARRGRESLRFHEGRAT